MTASIATERLSAAPRSPRLAGLRPLVRKEITEWIRGRRAWIVLTLSTLFMVLTAANAWIVTRIAAALPPEVDPPDLPTSMAAVDNLAAAFGTQIFVIAAIFAVTSLIVRERESGTLAWVASKPVSRGAIWLSKWSAASGVLVATAVLLPLAITAAVTVLLYGPLDVAMVAPLVLGASAIVVFYAALGLAAGVVMPGQPAIAATGFLVFALVPALAGLIPLPIEPFLPTSILGWSAGLATGQAVGWVTPVAWAVGTGLLVAVAVRRMQRIEL
jgi:ABC-2 type transport system permease protein